MSSYSVRQVASWSQVHTDDPNEFKVKYNPSEQILYRSKSLANITAFVKANSGEGKPILMVINDSRKKTVRYNRKTQQFGGKGSEI